MAGKYVTSFHYSFDVMVVDNTVVAVGIFVLFISTGSAKNNFLSLTHQHFSVRWIIYDGRQNKGNSRRKISTLNWMSATLLLWTFSRFSVCYCEPYAVSHFACTTMRKWWTFYYTKVAFLWNEIAYMTVLKIELSTLYTSYFFDLRECQWCKQQKTKAM